MRVWLPLTLLLAIGLAADPSHAASASCASQANAQTCPASDVGKPCPGGGVCYSFQCAADGGDVTMTFCGYTDQVGGQGCSCAMSDRAPSAAGLGGAAIALAAASRRRPRPRQPRARVRARG